MRDVSRPTADCLKSINAFTRTQLAPSLAVSANDASRSRKNFSSARLHFDQAHNARKTRDSLVCLQRLLASLRSLLVKSIDLASGCGNRLIFLHLRGAGLVIQELLVFALIHAAYKAVHESDARELDVPTGWYLIGSFSLRAITGENRASATGVAVSSTERKSSSILETTKLLIIYT